MSENENKLRFLQMMILGLLIMFVAGVGDAVYKANMFFLVVLCGLWEVCLFWLLFSIARRFSQAESFNQPKQPEVPPMNNTKILILGVIFCILGISLFSLRNMLLGNNWFVAGVFYIAGYGFLGSGIRLIFQVIIVWIGWLFSMKQKYKQNM